MSLHTLTWPSYKQKMKGIMKLQKGLIWKVLIRNPTSSLFTNSFSRCCLLALRVGQVRLIFALPDYLRGHNLPRYHACIEWFNPFRAPNADSKLYSVTRSQRNNAPITEIVPLASIVSSCYLTPKFGTTYHPARWSSADIVEESKFFTLNKYISLYMFYKLEQKN
jgi:hypothetical protein